MRRLFSLLALTLLSFGQGVFAEPDSSSRDEQMAEKRRLADDLHYQEGEIVLKGGLATINVPRDFRYIDAAQANTVLTKIWNNPPGEENLGMLFPATSGPMDDGGWGVLIEYEEKGYVKDNDAETIDYNELLKKMQADVQESNAVRQKEGYPTIDLIGWAAPPRYDKETHKFYWAKEIAVDGNSSHTLNYNIRILGRKGVLVLTVIAGMDSLAEVETATPSILKMVNFQQGSRYVDFNPSTDKVAAYGLAALVAGGILAKAGGFKLLLPVLLAAKKFIAIGIFAVIAWGKKIMAKLRGQGQSPPLA